MSLWNMTMHRVKKVLAWVFTIIIIAMVAFGVVYLVEVI